MSLSTANSFSLNTKRSLKPISSIKLEGEGFRDQFKKNPRLCSHQVLKSRCVLNVHPVTTCDQRSLPALYENKHVNHFCLRSPNYVVFTQSEFIYVSNITVFVCMLMCEGAGVCVRACVCVCVCVGTSERERERERSYEGLNE